MKLAAQLYTVRDFTKTPEDVRKTFAKIKQTGYDAVQVSGFGPIAPQLLKEYADESGLEICATHTPFDRIINDTEAVIAEHRLWNCPYVGLGAMNGEYRRDKEGYDEFLRVVLPAAEKIHASSLKFLYHNHRFEFAKIDGSLTGIEYLAAKTQPEAFGFLADFYWVQAGGASPLDFIKKHGARLDVVHFKDMAVVDDAITMAEIFEGNMDYEAIYSVCLENGVEWAAVEQDTCPGDPFDSLKISFDNLKARGLFV